MSYTWANPNLRICPLCGRIYSVSGATPDPACPVCAVRLARPGDVLFIWQRIANIRARYADYVTKEEKP